MSRFIEVSPLPGGTTLQTVKEIFQPFTINRFAIVGSKAYLELADINDIQTLDFTFENGVISRLDDALITPLEPDFAWPNQNPVQPDQFILNTDQQRQEEEIKVEEKQQQENFILETQKEKPGFIIVKNCNQAKLENYTKADIRREVFGRYNIGRIYVWDSDLYAQFLNGKDISLLKQAFPSLVIPLLGQKSMIDRVDENFSPELIQDKVREHEQAEVARKAEEQAKKQRQIEEKAKKMQEIQKRSIKKQKQEEEKKAAELQRKSVPQREQVSYGGEHTHGRNTWTVQPDSARPERNNSTDSVKLSSFWLIVTIGWAFYAVLY